MWFRCSVVVLLVGCTGDAPITATDPVSEDTGPFVPTLPGPPPSLDPCEDFGLQAPTSLGPGQTAFLAVSAGIGPWSWSLVANHSGGAINAGTGEWLAGPAEGIDVVGVYDEGCDRQETASVSILPSLVAVPERARVPAGQSFEIMADGGSGGWGCEPVTLEAGASLAGCAFVAGGVGVNLVRVVDSQTGLMAAAEIHVEDGVELLSESVLLVPVGHPMRPEPIGGSGAFDIVPTGGLQVLDGELTATAPGSYAVTALDPATGLAQPLTVLASTALTVPAAGLSRDGEFLSLGQIRFGDLDGDGFDDLVVSTADRAVAARQGGAVLIYPGSASGFAAVPSQMFGSDQPDSRAGRSLAVADFNDDGELDIAVGEYVWDRGARINAGRVAVYPGIAGGYVDVDSVYTLEGTDAYDQLGSALVSCDVDGDGVQDLIVGGIGLDDDSVSPTVSNTGGLQIYFGGSDGLSDPPDRRWFAQRPSSDGTGWADALRAEAGSSLAAGDLDGDGRCDVAVGAATGDAFSADDSQGGVWLLRDEELLSAPGPAWRVIGVTEAFSPTIELGTQVALQPVLGSTFDAVVVSARRASNEAGDSQAGAVYAYRTQDLGTGPATRLVEHTAFDWSFEGSTSNDWVGLGLALAPDGSLRIGGPRAASTSGGGERGVVFQVAIDFSRTVPLTAVDTAIQFDGEVSGSYFGAVLGVAGTGEQVVLAPRQNHADVVPVGASDGALYVDGVEVEMPTPVIGGSVGTSVALVDIDGGSTDTIAGATGIALEIGSDSGAVAVWSGGPGVLRPQVDDQDRDEAFGSQVLNIGDLNGDGFDDLAVVGFQRTVAAALPATYATGSCPGGETRSTTGAVYLWLGGVGGMSDQPNFVIFGVDARTRLNAVTRAFDFDGDGEQGIAVSSYRDETVWVYDGPWTPTPGSIVEHCAPESTLVGPGSSSFGIRIAAVPSVDGDACDELAVSASEDDVAGSSRGALRLFRGCAGGGASWKTWTSDTNGHRLGGGGLAVGDANNDGVLDLVVGSVSLDISGRLDVGAAWFIDGASFVPVVWDNTDADANLIGLLPSMDASTVPPARLTGTVEAERLGTDLAIIGSGASAHVWVGRPGAEGSRGGVDGWRMGSGFERRVFMLGPERRYSGLGSALLSTGGSVVVVGVPHSDEGSVGGGAVYTFELP